MYDRFMTVDCSHWFCKTCQKTALEAAKAAMKGKDMAELMTEEIEKVPSDQVKKIVTEVL